MATSGALTAWLRQIVGGLPYEQLVREAAAVSPGSQGLVVLPYFAGERTPLFDPDARGIICGLTLSHGRGHLYRALLGATAYGVRHNLEAMVGSETGDQQVRLVAVGGGTKGGLWTQIVSDVTRRSQAVPEETIGASYGDALLAGLASGLVEPGGRWNKTAEMVQPTPATRDITLQSAGNEPPHRPAGGASARLRCRGACRPEDAPPVPHTHKYLQARRQICHRPYVRT
jgi:xylulokinase